MIHPKRIFITAFALLYISSSTLFSAGTVHDGKISTYLEGAFQEPSEVQSALKNAGFKILAEQQLDKEGDLTTVVFTCPTLKNMANKTGKGFGAILRVLINKADHEISITNPLYFAKAFLQDSYDDTAANKVLTKLNNAFTNLKDSSDAMQEGDLEGYHFMLGMPYYDDMTTVGEGKALLAKAKANKNTLFTLSLENGSTLIGYKINSETAKFAKKIGSKNASLLPYTILIENNKAKILAPKYYLALSYPSLSMSQFMTIATVPGAIEKDCAKGLK